MPSEFMFCVFPYDVSSMMFFSAYSTSLPQYFTVLEYHVVAFFMFTACTQYAFTSMIACTGVLPDTVPSAATVASSMHTRLCLAFPYP